MTLPAFLIVDVETTGLDPESDQLIEVGAVLFDADAGVPVETLSYLRAVRENPVESINRIPAAVAGRWGRIGDHTGLGSLANRNAFGHSHKHDHTVILAHNAEFDRQWLPSLHEHQWLCTYSDAIWPRIHGETGSLVNIALAYDVGIVRAHRAIEDCLTLAAVLSRVHELEGGLDDWYSRATEERREVIAKVSYDDRQLAKDAGFRWDGARKTWSKSVPVSRVASFVAGLPFGHRMGA